MTGIIELFIRYQIDPIIWEINEVFISVGFRRGCSVRFFNKFIIKDVKICRKEVV